MIDQLQRVVIPEPGPIGGRPCRGRFFTDYSAGPFKSASEMEGWFNHKLEICKHYRKAPQDTPEFKFTEFVLVHKDISPRNLILDPSGRLWLVDWGHAGAYPPAFEKAAIAWQYWFPEFNTTSFPNATRKCDNYTRSGMD
jgi:thiamine kinase-like enzyme